MRRFGIYNHNQVVVMFFNFFKFIENTLLHVMKYNYKNMNIATSASFRIEMQIFTSCSFSFHKIHLLLTKLNMTSIGLLLTSTIRRSVRLFNRTKG
jgi:hypothetical protein